MENKYEKLAEEWLTSDREKYADAYNTALGFARFLDSEKAQEDTLEDLIYSTGKGVELQVWDGGTVYCELRYDGSSAEAGSVPEAIRRAIKAQEVKPKCGHGGTSDSGWCLCPAGCAHSIATPCSCPCHSPAPEKPTKRGYAPDGYEGAVHYCFIKECRDDSCPYYHKKPVEKCEHEWNSLTPKVGYCRCDKCGVESYNKPPVERIEDMKEQFLKVLAIRDKIVTREFPFCASIVPMAEHLLDALNHINDHD